MTDSGAAPRRFWAPFAWTGRAFLSRFEVAVDAGGRIESVTDGTGPSPGATRFEGVLLPGLVNVHSHAFHRVLRGHTHDAGDFWGWRQAMYAVAERLDPDSYEELATAVFGEMALAGITAVGEFHYLHHDLDGTPYADANAMGHAVVNAARAAGIAITLLDTCYLTADVDGAPVQGTQERFSDRSAAEWARRHRLLAEAYGGAPDVVVGAAIHSVRAVPGDDMPLVVEASGSRPLHVHVSEQRLENERSLEVTGRTPMEILHSAGALGPRTTIIHGVHLSPADRDLLAATGSAVCVCPSTELDLGDGVAPVLEMVEEEIPLSLGSDSHAVIDLFHEARMIELNDRGRLERRRVHQPQALLRMLTVHGAKALGRDSGELVPGRWADLVVVNDESVRTAGANTPGSLLFTATAADVSDVVARGQLIVAGGEHQLLGSVADSLARALAKPEASL